MKTDLTAAYSYIKQGHRGDLGDVQGQGNGKWTQGAVTENLSRY